MFPPIALLRLFSARPYLWLAVALLTVALITSPAAPALADSTGDAPPKAYVAKANAVDVKALPDGGAASPSQVPIAPEMSTAAAPGGWLQPTTTTEYDVTHTVQSDDTLGKLAQAYGFDAQDGWRVLYDANSNVKQPSLLYPGMKLQIPANGDEVTRRALPTPAPAPAPAPAQKRAERASEPARASRSSSGGTAVSGGRWDTLAACESNGNWSINTGNGYYGGIQFSLSSWRMVGGSGYPHQASKAEQINRGEKLLAMQGWKAWPACTRKLGWR